MNKEELVQEVAKKTKASQKDVADILTALLETVEKTVAKGKKVTLVGFGTFEPRKRSARTGRNPQTGEELKIPAKVVPAFTAGKRFRDQVATAKVK
ncbi:MAG: HU family DNA-binding protein [Vampirovibrionales bacterium]